LSLISVLERDATLSSVYTCHPYSAFVFETLEFFCLGSNDGHLPPMLDFGGAGKGNRTFTAIQNPWEQGGFGTRFFADV
jgi:hypothetical protein